MQATEQFFDFLRKIRKLNNINGQIAFDDSIKRDARLYMHLAEMYRDIINVNLPVADIFFAQFACEVAVERFEQSKDLLKKELSFYFNWYESNKVVIDKFFSHDVILEVINYEVKRQYGFEIMAAKMEVEKAAEDEAIWHNLARAYGSRAYADRTYKDFNDDDKDYISGALKRYELHFNKTVYDFEKMYDEYRTIGRHLVDEPRQQYSMAIKKSEEYRYMLLDEGIIEDVFTCFKEYFQPYLNYLLGETKESNVLTQNATSTIPKNTRRGYGRYNTLDECIPNKDIVEVIDKCAENYYNANNKIDTIFGRQIFDYLKKTHYLKEENCARDHFGELLLKRYGDKCSFKKGKSLEGNNKKLDEELGVWIRDFMSELTRQKEG